MACSPLRYTEQVCSETSAQTSNFSTSEKGCNTSTHSSTGIQTETEEKPRNEKHDEEQMKRLAGWLQRIYPKVTKQLDNINATTHFFKDYNKLLDENQEASCKLLQSMSLCSPTESGEQALIISHLSWNQTGKSLAVSCNYEHATWCHHSGAVLIYALDTILLRIYNGEKPKWIKHISTFSKDNIPSVPRKKLKTQSCVTSLKFHLTNPAIIAAGTFSGNIYIWNTQNDGDDNQVLSQNGHEDFITQISWVYDLDTAKTVLLASSSTDGLLKLWKFRSSDNNLRLKARYKIKYPVLGYINGKPVIKSESLATKSCIGVVCFDFSTFVPDIFVVGLEGGLIVQCSVLGSNILKGNTKEEPLLDPVFKYYEPHEGEIIDIKFSPNRKEMFLTSATDGEVRIYLTGQDEPAQVIFLKDVLNDISWIPHEDKLVAGCGQNGKIDIFNLKTAKGIKDVTEEKVPKNTLCSMAINNSKINFTAVGDNKGNLQLWSVPWYLFATVT